MSRSATLEHNILSLKFNENCMRIFSWKADHIIMRKGDRIRSLNLLYHGRLIHCSCVNSMAFVTSQLNSSSICWANSSLYPSPLNSYLPTELRRSRLAVPMDDLAPYAVQVFPS